MEDFIPNEIFLEWAATLEMLSEDKLNYYTSNKVILVHIY